MALKAVSACTYQRGLLHGCVRNLKYHNWDTIITLLFSRFRSTKGLKVMKGQISWQTNARIFDRSCSTEAEDQICRLCQEDQETAEQILGDMSVVLNIKLHQLLMPTGIQDKF